MKCIANVEREDLGPWWSVKHVWFNGEIANGVMEADDVEGYIIALKQGDDGKFLFDEEKKDDVTERLEGEVRFEMVEDADCFHKNNIANCRQCMYLSRGETVSA